jgi:pyruvate formate-lyase activating enzyme-like uncharacterized protein
MILDVTESSLPAIKNPVLRTYANKYIDIYRDFMRQVAGMGLEIEAQDTTAQVAERIAALRKKGATIRNGEKSIYTNRISPSCEACQIGVTSTTFFVSLKCHRDCFYCFNPNQQEYEFYREHTRDTIAELDALHQSNPAIKHLALTGGEPLLFKEETYGFFEHARQQFPAAHKRLYTCGDHIDVETLEKLKAAGLDEIRFSIRMHDLAKGQTHTFDNIALAKKYIPNVMVEMPVLPDTLEEMKDVLLRLDALGIFGINLLEFCFPLNNPEVFREKGFSIKGRPFRVLYDYWYAGGLPIAGSETVCLDLIEFALEQKMKLGVHYCSLENKHTGQVYQQNNGHPIPKTMYFSQKDFFLKTARVFGDDIPLVQAALDRSGQSRYQVNSELGYLEFHPEHVKSLGKLEVEIGISSNVIETREEELVLRELKVDVTTPQTFRFSKDI